MSEQDNNKTLSSEKLPDPSSAAEDLSNGSPRNRTAEHLKRIIGASLVLPLAATVSGCSFIQQFGVVDPVPPPAVRPQPGFLEIKSTPIADIEINGKATGLKTPQEKIELAPGKHTVKLTSTTPSLTVMFTVEIKSGATLTENRDLREPQKESEQKPAVPER